MSSPIFAGVSSFASDLSKVITRSLSIAALPLQQLQNQRTDIGYRETALKFLDSKFGALQDAIKGLENALGPSSFSATTSNSTYATASLSAGSFESNITLDIASIGSQTNTISDDTLPAVTDPYSTSITTSQSFTLTVGGTSFTIDATDNSLVGLAKSINSAGAGVQASVINTGSSSAPSYRLVLRSNKLGPVDVQLNDGTQDLLNTLNTGTLASYTINGLPTPIESDSRTVTLAPGLTVDLVKPTPTGEPVTVTVSRQKDSLSEAIQAFVTAFNDVGDALGKQVGKDSGALSGDSIISSLNNVLSRITQFNSGSGTVNSLTRLGVELDSHGILTFNESKFASASIDDVQAFLGSAATGGFLKAATEAIDQVEDTSNGSVKSALKLINAQATRQDALIAKEQDRLTDLQATLQQRMAAADTLLAGLESKRDYMKNLFTVMLNSNKSGVS